MIISLDAVKAFDKNLTVLYDKSLGKGKDTRNIHDHNTGVREAQILKIGLISDPHHRDSIPDTAWMVRNQRLDSLETFYRKKSIK